MTTALHRDLELCWNITDNIYSLIRPAQDGYPAQAIAFQVETRPHIAKLPLCKKGQ